MANEVKRVVARAWCTQAKTRGTTLFRRSLIGGKKCQGNHPALLTRYQEGKCQGNHPGVLILRTQNVRGTALPGRVALVRGNVRLRPANHSNKEGRYIYAPPFFRRVAISPLKPSALPINKEHMESNRYHVFFHLRKMACSVVPAPLTHLLLFRCVVLEV